MLFSSLTFIFIFLPLLLIFYFSFKNIKIKNIILLVFSLIFYSWGEPKYILLMLITTLVIYTFGILISNNKNNKKKSKIFLTLGIIFVLSLLFIFKYFNFFISTLNSVINSKIKLTNLVLPLGISFYSFQLLSYLIDLYKDKVQIQKNYLKLLLYVSFFPQLIAGPIVRYETIEQEIDNRKTTLNDFIEGFKRVILGLAKKVLIANNVAAFCDYVYSNFNHYGSSILWVAAIAYTIQIYFDFSGYSDMAIGLGRIFGFKFLENFNYPYTATSITDFWRKWHISLSTFFRDYVYIPLGGNRVKKPIQIRNILIVWFLTGLWHGASWNFIIWGMYYGIILLIEKFILKKYLDKLPIFIKRIYSIIIIIIGWVIFRIEEIPQLLKILKIMFTFKQSNYLNLFQENLFLITYIPFIILGIIFSLPIYKKFKNKINQSKKIYLTLIDDLILGILFGLSVMSLVSNQYNPFIYFRF